MRNIFVSLYILIQGLWSRYPAGNPAGRQRPSGHSRVLQRVRGRSPPRDWQQEADGQGREPGAVAGQRLHGAGRTFQLLQLSGESGQLPEDRKSTRLNSSH